MWKIVVGFILFAALTMFVLFKGGEVDMGGEKHGAEATHAPAATASAPAPVAVASAPAAEAASAPASAAASAAK